MKKKILSLLLTLTMLLTLAPAFGVGASAVTPVTLCVDASADDDSAARADGAVYKTLAGAISAAASAGDTVKLMSDVTEKNVCVWDGKSITVDLNGKVFSLDGSHGFVVYGTMTLIDSAPTAEHKYRVEDDGLWVLDESGTKTVYGGLLTGGAIGCNPIRMEHNGVVNMEAGSIIGNRYNSVLHNGEPDKYTGPTLNMSGGAIKGNSVSYVSAVTSGDGGCSFNMTGGVISDNQSEQGVTVRVSSNMTIGGNARIEGNNGLYDGPSGGVYVEGAAGSLTVKDDFTGSFSVSGDLFKGSVSNPINIAPGNPIVLASSSTAIPNTIRYEGNGNCIAYTVKNYDGYHLKLGIPTAAVGRKQYGSVQDAVDAAGENETVRMLADSTEQITVAADDTVTIDMDGHILNAPVQNRVIYNVGKLTLTDSSRNKYNYFTYKSNAADWERFSGSFAGKTVVALKDIADASLTTDGTTVIKVTGGVIAGANYTAPVAPYGGGKVNCEGGCIYNEGTLNVSNINFIGNYAGGNGGAVQIEENCKADIENTIFYGNTALDWGGAIHSKAKAASGGSFTVAKSAFICNQNIGQGQGGAVNAVEATFTDCLFTGNKSAHSGGAISYFKSLTLDSCTIVNNSSNNDNPTYHGGRGGGGGVYYEIAYSTKELIIEGNTVIKDNKRADTGKDSNTYMASGISITIGEDGLASDAYICVDTEKNPTVGSSIAITKNSTAEDLQHFACDNGSYAVVSDDGKVKLVTKQETREAPTGLAGVRETRRFRNNGKITGVTDEMEYRLSSAADYIKVSEGATVIENLAAGTYRVRYAKGTYYASADTTVIVPAGPDYVKTFSCTLSSDIVNGAVGLDKASAAEGETVTVTVTPDTGYTLETITVRDNEGSEIALTAKESGRTYTFKMPACGVTVTATFMDDNTVLNAFTDVKASEYYYDAVLWAVRNGIANGIDDLHFGSEKSCDRGQVVTFLHRAFGSPAASRSAGFADVPSHWYFVKAVDWAAEKGITTGTDKGFEPFAKVTRAQFVTFLWRAAGSPEAAGTAGFADVPENEYYAAAAAWAVENGISNGMGKGFSPDAVCDRGQVVTFLYRYFVK